MNIKFTFTYLCGLVVGFLLFFFVVFLMLGLKVLIACLWDFFDVDIDSRCFSQNEVDMSERAVSD